MVSVSDIHTYLSALLTYQMEFYVILTSPFADSPSLFQWQDRTSKSVLKSDDSSARMVDVLIQDSGSFDLQK